VNGLEVKAGEVKGLGVGDVIGLDVAGVDNIRGGGVGIESVIGGVFLADFFRIDDAVVGRELSFGVHGLGFKAVFSIRSKALSVFSLSL
jgi:hypothetical protein